MCGPIVSVNTKPASTLHFKRMVKLANDIGEHIKLDMFVKYAAQFGHHVDQLIHAKKCSRRAFTCSKHFREHLLLNGMLSN